MADEKLGNRRNYTRLSRQFGLTVPRVKSALAEAGLLFGKEPTAKAIADGVVVVKMIEGQYSGGQLVPMLLWRIEDVEVILTEQGLMDNAPQRADVFIKNGHGALGRIEEAGALLKPLFEKRWKNNDEVRYAVFDMIHETIEIVYGITDDYPAVVQWLSPKKLCVQKALKKYKLDTHPDAIRAMAKLDSVLAWIQR